MAMRKYILIAVIIILAPVYASGANLLWSDGFESGIENWSNLYGSNSQSSDRAHSGTYSKKTDRSLGSTQCIRDITGDENDMPTTGKLFVRFWVYLTPGPDFSGKLSRLIQQTGGNEAQMEFWSTGNAFYAGLWYWRDGGAHCPGSPNSAGSAGATTLIEGQWNKVEYYIELNTPGSDNGRMRIWINRNSDNFNSPNVDKQNVAFRQTGDCGAEYSSMHLPTGYDSGAMDIIYVDDVEVWDELPDGTPPSTPTIRSGGVRSGGIR